MWIDTLPYAAHYDVFGLIILGLLVEKHYVSRTSIFANTIAINVHFIQYPAVDSLFVWYANIGLIFGSTAIISYAIEESLPSEFYSISIAYSSIPVGLLILFTL
jgi:hypothetical protein